MQLNKQKIFQAIAVRLDGWVNALTNLGKMGKDKRTGARVDLDFLDQATLEALYQTDPLAAKIVDKPAKEMLRKGFYLDIKEDTDGLGVQILERAENFDLKKKLETCLIWARLYGGAGLIIGIKGDDPEKPIDLNRIGEVEYLTVVDRFRLNSDGQIQHNPTQPNFGYPEFYRVNADSSEQIPFIHHSRVIRFDGVEIPHHLRNTNDYWGDSVLSRLYNNLRNYSAAHDSASLLIQDFAIPIFKMKNLSQMIAGGQDDLVAQRLALVSMVSSISNALVIQDDEEYERKSTSVAGLPELLKKVDERLVAAADMPHTLVLGDSAGGLGSTGESEKRDWHEFIEAEQVSRLKPALNKIMDVLFSEKTGPAKGRIPEKYEIKFHPLKQMNEKETVEIRKIQSEIDAAYISSGVLDPDEVVQASFGNGEYSIETKVDMELRKQFEEASQPENQPDVNEPDNKPEDKPEEDGETIQS